MQELLVIVNTFGIPFGAMVVMGIFCYRMACWMKPQVERLFNAHVSLMSTLDEVSRDNSRLIREMHDELFRRDGPTSGR